MSLINNYKTQSLGRIIFKKSLSIFLAFLFFVQPGIFSLEMGFAAGPSVQTKGNIKDTDKNKILPTPVAPAPVKKVAPTPQKITPLPPPSTKSTPDTVVSDKKCEDYGDSYYSSLIAMWAGEAGNCHSLGVNKTKSKYTKLDFGNGKICYKMDELYCTELKKDTKTTIPQQGNESFVPSNPVVNPAPVSTPTNTTPSPSDDSGYYGSHTPTYRSSSGGGGGGSQSKSDEDECPQAGGDQNGEGGKDDIETAWKEGKQAKCYQYYQGTISQATMGGITAAAQISFNNSLNPKLVNNLSQEDFGKQFGSNSNDLPGAYDLYQNGNIIKGSDGKFYMTVDDGKSFYEAGSTSEYITDSKIIDNNKAIFERQQIAMKQTELINKGDMVAISPGKYVEFDSGGKIITKDLAPTEEVYARNLRVEKLEQNADKSQSAYKEAVKKHGENSDEASNAKVKADKDASTADKFKAQADEENSQVPITDRATDFLSRNFGQATMHGVSQGFSYYMACKGRPGCDATKVGLSTAVGGFVGSYAGQAIGGGGASAGAGAAIGAGVVNYMQCKSSGKGLSQQEQEQVQKGCQTQTMWSAGTSIATTYVSSISMAGGTTTFAEYVGSKVVGDTAGTAAGSTASNTAGTATAGANPFTATVSPGAAVGGAIIGGVISAVSVLLQGGSPKQAAMAGLQAVAMGIASYYIAGYLTGAYVTFMSTGVPVLTFMGPMGWVVMAVGIVLSLLMQAFGCPYYYVVLPSGEVVLQGAILVGKVGEKLKGDSYEKVESEKGLIKIKIAEQFNEDLYLDSVSLVQVLHKPGEEVILDDEGKVHEISGAKKLRVVASEGNERGNPDDELSQFKIFNLKFKNNLKGENLKNGTNTGVIASPRSLSRTGSAKQSSVLNLEKQGEKENNEKIVQGREEYSEGQEQIAINLPKISNQTDMIISGGINPSTMLQTQTKELKEIASKKVPAWAVDPLYFVLDKFPFVGKFLGKMINEFEGINLEKCEKYSQESSVRDSSEDENLDFASSAEGQKQCSSWKTVDTIITYPTQKRVFNLGEDLIGKDLRLRFNSKVVTIDELWYEEVKGGKLKVESGSDELLITNYKPISLPSELELTDNVYKVMTKGEEIDLEFSVNENKEGYESTYFLKTNGFYHPRGNE